MVFRQRLKNKSESRRIAAAPSAVPAIPVSDKRGDHFLALSKDAAKKLASSGFIWCIALMVSFQLVDSQISSQLTEIRENESAIRVSKESLAKLQDEAKKEAKKEEIKKLEQNQKAPAKPITFSLPGLTSISIAPPLAPAAWLGISFLVLLHLAGIRRQAHGYLALAIGLMPNTGRAVPIAAPFRALLAPLPTRDGSQVASADFSAAYGLPSEAGTSRLLVGTAFACLLLAQLWMLWVQSKLSLQVKPSWLAPTLQVVSVAVVGATLVSAGQWMRRWRVPDADFLPQGQNLGHRREFLELLTGAVFCVGMGKVAAKPVASQAPCARFLATPVLAGFRWNPRYRVRRDAPGAGVKLSEGEALDGRARLAPSVEGNQARGVRGTKVQRENLLRSRDAYSRFVGGADRSTPKAFDAEQALLMGVIRADLDHKRASQKYIQSGPRHAQHQRRPFRPCRAYEPQMTRDNTDSKPKTPRVAIHLYDRLARNALRAKRRDAIDKLLAFMQKESLDTAFASRVAKWGNPNSKWARKQTTAATTSTFNKNAG